MRTLFAARFVRQLAVQLGLFCGLALGLAADVSALQIEPRVPIVRPGGGEIPAERGRFIAAAAGSASSDFDLAAPVIAGRPYNLTRQVDCPRADTVDLSLGGAPPGAIPSFNPNPAAANQTFNLNLPIPLTTVAGDYLLSVQGTSRN